MNRLTATLLALLYLSSAEARTYVVSPDGDDATAGTEDAPLRTIGRAAGLMQAGDVCRVRAGTYAETVRPANSGVEGNPVVFENWPGERPCVEGCDPVTRWKQVQDTIWRAPVDWNLDRNNQVFVDGVPGQEARWPNKTNRDPLDWEGVAYDKGSCNEFLLCSALPDRPDGYWRDTTLWTLAGAKWTSWSTVVKDSTASGRKLIFNLPATHGSVTTHMSPADRRGGFFYLVGHRGELDAPGEWYLDGQEKMLYICLGAGQDANTLRIAAKRRAFAFDLTERQHVRVSGFDIRAASLSLRDAEHCLIRDVRANWIGHTRGGRTSYGLNEDLGVIVSGHHNTIRDSEIAWSAGNGVRLQGERQELINCWIHHTDYTGSYDAPVKVWGSEMLISHNTIHDTGRDCIQPGGQGHVIQYNNIHRMGRLAHDLGATYVCGSDGGGTEFHHNWCHDNLAHGTRMGIYLDNFTSFYFVYRNVVWNINGCDIRLNKPSLHNVVANNTMMGNSGNWGRWKTDWMYGCAYVNNAVRGTIKTHPQARFVANTFEIRPETLNPDNFKTYTEGAGQGCVLPGLTGTSPGIGAYEPTHSWTAGHDFAHPPNPTYTLTDTPLRNAIRHGSFDWSRWRGTLGPWTPTGARSAKVIRGPGGISQSYTTRDTIIDDGMQLAGETNDGVEQVIRGLRPNHDYELGAWVKLKGGATVTVGIRGNGIADDVATSTPATDWQRLRVRFTSGATAGDATVFVTRTGPGTAFIDDISLVGVVKGIEPALPGFAPVAP